ncbi:putative uncharacterized protein DDB_G0288973 [Palaemon carinicauda]|uniref:putative uncharacterized protein DDB_G0288973 n=1 Tax=Palaemon carinicauda TaxID=392227 RepID=UPI0035B63482
MIKVCCVILITCFQFSSVLSDYETDILETIQKTLRENSKIFLEKNKMLMAEKDLKIEQSNAEILENKNNLFQSIEDNLEEKFRPPGQLINNASDRRRRSTCPGGVGNFGFNSFNLLTFALQVFNGVINTINNINNNNNNNNINALNSANSNFNQQTSNTNSMSMLMIIVPPGKRRRRRRDEWNNESAGCASLDEESRKVVEDTYSTLAEIVNLSKKDLEYCGEYVLCLNVQNSFARFGFQILSAMADKEGLWEAIARPMVSNRKCSDIYPECHLVYNEINK